MLYRQYMPTGIRASSHVSQNHVMELIIPDSAICLFILIYRLTYNAHILLLISSNHLKNK